MARTAKQDEKLNDLYRERDEIEDFIMRLPKNVSFQDNPAWLENEAAIRRAIGDPIEGDPESERGMELLANARAIAFNVSLFDDLRNEDFEDARQVIEDLRYRDLGVVIDDDTADDMADYRLQQEAGVSF